MAAQSALVTVSCLDAAGVRKAYSEYFLYNDAVTTLANIISFAQEAASRLNGVSDAKITSVGVFLQVNMPGGLKSSPAANSDVEESLAVSISVSNPKKSAYTVIVPAVTPNAVVGTSINMSDIPTIMYVAHLAYNSNGIRLSDDKWSGHLYTLLHGKKVFRKSRRALKRA
jgi:hypothetical protein